jgi:hypothetical protein
MCSHHAPPPPPTLQQPPSSFEEKKQTPAFALCITHSRPDGQLSATPGMQLCVQICWSEVPVQTPLLQNCGKLHESPTSPTGGSQKHLPASHFWPAAQLDALSHGAPLVTVTTEDSVAAPRSS